MFALFRHPDLPGQLGAYPQAAADQQRARGWYRVTPWQADPDFHLPDHAGSDVDLDAEPAAPKPSTRAPRAGTSKGDADQ